MKRLLLVAVLVVLVTAIATLLLPVAKARADDTGVVTDVTGMSMDLNAVAVPSDTLARPFWHDGTATFYVKLSGPASLVQYMILGQGYPEGDPEDPNDPHWQTLSGDHFSMTVTPQIQGFHEIDFQTDGAGGAMGFDNNGPWYFGLDAGDPVITYTTTSQGVAASLGDGKWHNLRADPTGPASGSITFHAEDYGTGLGVVSLFTDSGIEKWTYDCQNYADLTKDLTTVKCAVLEWKLWAFDEAFSHLGVQSVTMKIDQLAPKFTKPKSMRVKRGSHFTIPVRVVDPSGVGGVCSRLSEVRARLTGPSFNHVLCSIDFPGDGEPQHNHGVTGRLARSGTYKVSYFAKDEAGNVTTTSFPLYVSR